jgi:hypothetical protein
MELPVLYARREPADDAVLLNLAERTNLGVRHMDVVLYEDMAATQPVSRYPWHYKQTAQLRRRSAQYIMHNCDRYRVLWLHDIPWPHLSEVA